LTVPSFVIKIFALKYKEKTKKKSYQSQSDHNISLYITTRR
jgi:hypothetical protein